MSNKEQKGSGLGKKHRPQDANLTPWNSDSAKQAQLASAKARSANVQARKERAARRMEFIELIKDEAAIAASCELSGLDTMKLLMQEALVNEDNDTAAELAFKIAEFEQPKLARVDSITTELDTTSASSKDLEAYLAGKITSDELAKRSNKKK